jgi:hypothetical protein
MMCRRCIPGASWAVRTFDYLADMVIPGRCSPPFLVPRPTSAPDARPPHEPAYAYDHRGVIWRCCCRPAFHRDRVWIGSSSNERHQARTLVTRFASIAGKPAAMLMKSLKLKFASTSHCSALAQPRLRSCTCRGACSVNNVKRGTADGGA